MSGQPHLGGAVMSSQRALRERALVRCAYCGIEGPKARLSDHVSADHPELVTPAGSGFMVSIPPRFRPAIDAIHAQTGAPFGTIVAAALDRVLPAGDTLPRKGERQQ